MHSKYFLILLFLLMTLTAFVIISCKQKAEDNIRGPESAEETKDKEAETAFEYKSKGNFDEAIPLFDNLFKNEGKWVYLTALGECYIEKGEYDIAKIKLDEAMKREPDNSYNYRAYSSLYLRTKDLDQAQDYAQKALKHASLDEERAHAYFKLAEIYRARGMKDTAVKNAKEAIKLLPDNAHYKSFLDEIKESE